MKIKSVKEKYIDVVDNKLTENVNDIYCGDCTVDDIILMDDVLTSDPNEKKPRKIIKCEHGTQKSYCVPCKGSQICVHDKQKTSCRDCGGSKFCIHDKLKQQCKTCSPLNFCEHGKRKSHCKKCGGTIFCEHGKQKARCKDCGGSQICIHEKQKSNCKDCKGSSFCEHGKRKEYCRECHGSQICEHDKIKSRCKDCEGSDLCEHGKHKSICKDCGGSLMCKHGKYKSKCKDCGGSGLCVHEKQKSRCRDCGGSSFCEHGKRKSRCILCKGSEICAHNKLKSCCKLCGGKSLCKSEWCETSGNPKYERYCVYCYTNLFPDKPIVRNNKTKERNVVDNVKKCYPNFTWVTDKQIQDGCSRKRPDLLLDLGSHIIIVEIDENAHTNYDCSCENKRLMGLSEDVGHRPIVFIRFNPDQYVDNTGEIIKSCWKINKTSGILQIDAKKECEWKERINMLIEEIQYWINNQSEKIVEIIELFY